MSTPTRTHTYRGYRIEPCESCYAPREHKGHWAIRTRHAPSGIPWADQECSHAYTLADAKRKVDEMERDA